VNAMSLTPLAAGSCSKPCWRTVISRLPPPAAPRESEMLLVFRSALVDVAGDSRRR
jgi:hypothetical protein